MYKGGGSGLFSEPQCCDQLPSMASKLAREISWADRQTSQHQKQGLFEVLRESSRLLELPESAAEGGCDSSVWGTLTKVHVSEHKLSTNIFVLGHYEGGF